MPSPDRTDSERLDWLGAKNPGWKWKIEVDEMFADVVLCGALEAGSETLRQAIDAAMDAEEEGDG